MIMDQKWVILKGRWSEPSKYSIFFTGHSATIPSSQLQYHIICIIQTPIANTLFWTALGQSIHNSRQIYPLDRLMHYYLYKSYIIYRL